MGPNSASCLRLETQKTVDTREKGLLAFVAAARGFAAVFFIAEAM